MAVKIDIVMLSLKYLLVCTRQVAWALQGQMLLLSPVQALVTRALTPLGLWVLLLPKVGTPQKFKNSVLWLICI